MSTIYKGKLYFTEHDLTTKYDRVNINNCDYLTGKASHFEFSNRLIYQTHVDQNLINKKLKLNSNEDSNTLNTSVDEWINFDTLEDFQFLEDNLEINKNLLQPTCSNCVSSNAKIYNVNNANTLKVNFINLVTKSILYGISDLMSNILLCNEVAKEDPEFILKVSLYCRKELNIRSISNFLVGAAVYSHESILFLKKYFQSIVNLPTDWIEVVYHYMLISKSTCLPNQLKKALTNKFKEFSIYQLGKYQNKKMTAEINSKKIKLSLKSLVRILHICEPVESVMSVLGKNYPLTKDEFFIFKLPGQWDESKAGKRMKIPTPETWETQISLHGNKPEVWQKLIDNKSLPYMAMVRNLRNLLQSNINDYYHIKVAQYISKESNVINGRLLPFQYFIAYKILEEFNETILKAKEKLQEINPLSKKNNRQSKKALDRKIQIKNIIKLQKVSQRPTVSENVIKRYTEALNIAMEISTVYNIPPIRGKILILSNVIESSIYSAFKFGSSKSIKEVIALITSMCYFASEVTEIYLVKNFLVNKFQKNDNYKSILKMSFDILSDNEIGKITVDDLIDEMVASQVQFDMILTFDVNLSEKSLSKYISSNPSVLIFMNSLNTSLVNMNYKSSNIIRIHGFSEHTIKIISEYNNGNILKRIDLIDEKYNLCNAEEIIYCKSISNANIILPDTIQNEINIFISSTFLDMEKERSIINKIIVPYVKRNIILNVSNCIDINCIDLRWGVPSIWGQSEKLLQYCIEQVKRCHIFVGILGNRYGWIPDSKVIRNLSKIYPELKHYEGLSITNIEYQFATKNCHKVFLVKSARNEDFQDSRLKSFRDKIITNECYYEYSNENVLNDFKILISYLNNIIMEKLLLRNNINNSFLCDYHDQQTRYNKIINETINFLRNYTENIESFQKDEVNELLLVLEKKLSFEIDAHSFIDNHFLIASKNFGKKENKLRYAQLQSSGGILIIEGKPGSGKTSIVSELILQHYKKYSTSTETTLKLSSKLNFVWIFDVIKFINIEKSTDIYLLDLIYDIIEFFVHNLQYPIKDYLKKELQIYNEIKSEDFWRPVNIKHALLIWNLILKRMFMIKNLDVTIFIDGIDNLRDFSEASSLIWIPIILPPKFRIIITTLFNSKLSACCKLRKNAIIHEVKSIPILHKRKVIDSILKKLGKSLDSNPFENCMSHFTVKRDSNKPMYLRIAVNHLALHSNFDKVKEEINNLPSTLDDLILHILKSIEKEIPREICYVFFSFLNNSKAGFKMKDLQILMSMYFRVSIEKNTFLLGENDFNDIKIASKKSICFSMYPIIYIKNLSTLLLVEDKSGKFLIKDLFIKNLITKYTISIDKTVIIFIISIYCEEMLKFDDKFSYRDIIYYKFKSQLYEDCVALLTNIAYLKRRFELRIGEGLLSDYIGFEDTDHEINRVWLDICKRPIYKDFKIFISKNFHFLIKYPKFFIQQAINEPLDSCVNLLCNENKFTPFNFSNIQPVILKKNKALACKTEINSSVYYMFDKISHAVFGSILNLLSVGYENGLIQILNLRKFEALLNLRRHFSKVNKTFFFDNDTRLISVGEDCLVVVWNSIEGTILNELKAHLGPVTDCTVSMKSGLICTVSLDSQFIVWKSENFTLDHIFKTKSPINCITSHPSNDFKVIVGCWNGKMFIYNLSNYKKVAVIHNNKSVKAIAFHPFFELFLSSTINGEVSVWSSKNGIKLKNISMENKNYYSNVCYSSDGLQFIEFGANRNPLFGINIWSTSLGYNSNEKKLQHVTCVDANDQFIVCCTKLGQIIILNSNFTNKLQKTICETELTYVCLEKRNKLSVIIYFATVDYDKNFYLIQIIEDDLLIKKIESLHSRPVNVMYLLPNYLISGSDDCSIGFLKIKNNEIIEQLPLIINIFLDSILSIDVNNERILVGCKDRSIGLIKIKSFLLLNREIKAHDDWITTVRFTSSNNFISGSNDFTIKLWEIIIMNTKINEKSAKFILLNVIVSHIGPITSVSFNNGDIFASSSQDGTIKLWNMKGIFLDNIILEKNFSTIFEENIPIKWIKFLSTEYLLVLNSSSILYCLDFNKLCLVNKISEHREPVISVFDLRNELFTISVDGAIKKSSFQEIHQNKSRYLENFKITHSIHFSSILNLNDLIVAASDSGILLLIAKNNTNHTWDLFDTFDIKQYYYTKSNAKEFRTPFLQCSYFKKYSKHEVLMKICKSIFIFDLCTMSLKFMENDAIDLIEDCELQITNISEIIENESTIEITQNDEYKYLIRFTEKAYILELLLRKISEENFKILSKIPTSGIPCHIMMFINSYQEHEILIGYKHGNTDIIKFNQLL